MLAQSFKSAEELGLNEQQLDALIKTLVLMETDKLTHVPHKQLLEQQRAYRGDFQEKFCGLFNMGWSFADIDCGTAGCIRGTAQMISGVSMPVASYNEVGFANGYDRLCYDWGEWDPPVEAAARALRNFLTTGEPNWSQVQKDFQEVS